MSTLDATLLEMLPGASLILDDRGSVRALNSSAAALLGLDANDLSGDLDALASRLGLGLEEIRGVADVEGATRVGEWEIRVRSADHGFVLALARGGEQFADPSCAQCQKLEEVNAELGRVNSERARALNVIAHELRNPLVTIRGYVEMIARQRLGPLTQPQERGLAVALRNTIALSDQIDMLVEYSRIEADAVTFTKGPTDLGNLIHRVCGTVLERAKNAGLSIQTELLGDRDVQTEADPDKITLVLRALLDNAIKFTATGGIRVYLKTVEDRGREWVEVNVIDSGCGIDPAHHARIFEPFGQVVDGPTGRGKGAGLGLYVASVLVEAHDSKIVCESRPEEGARFWFRLPRS